MNKVDRQKRHVLEVAQHHAFSVHIYAWGAADMRRITRRMEKDGLLICVQKTRTHRYYRTPIKAT